MNWSRREFVIAGVGFAVSGCSSRYAYRPRHRRHDEIVTNPYTSRHTTGPHTGAAAAGGQQQAATSRYTAPSPRIEVIPRAAWTRAGVDKSNINPMKGISRITVHHEGYKPVWFADQASTVQRLNAIRSYHVDERHWADIGYHFIIDRSGRVWEGRSLYYQGAHVKENNEHNIGIMVLGNFDLQKPTNAQYASLQQALVALSGGYRVPINHIHTHQEYRDAATTCPGKVLQAHMVNVRHRGLG